MFLLLSLSSCIFSSGLGELFNEPNLCGLFPEQTDMPIALSDARHRATLVLSESGVEAAAASSLSFARSFPTFSAMQPFILVLWSDQANCPLFMGRVTQPWGVGEMAKGKEQEGKRETDR